MPGKRNKRQHLFDQQKGRCHYCDTLMVMDGNSRDLCTIDHVIPKSRDGHNGRHNCVGACRGCNNARGAHDYADFKEYVIQYGRPLGKRGIKKRARQRRAEAKAAAIKNAAAPWTRKMKSGGCAIDLIYKGDGIADALQTAEEKQTGTKGRQR